jgi:hypothetical membrane protein
VLCARLGYPSENNYSITNEMLSALGSFDAKHNPQYFWFFSIAMIYCGLIMIPIMFYIHRRFKNVSGLGATLGLVFFILACMAITLTGVFPYAHGKIIGDWQWKDFHMKTAGSIAIGFGIGIIIHAYLIFKDWLTRRQLAGDSRFPYLKLIGPFMICAPIFAYFGYNMKWDRVYSAIQALIHGSGRQAFEAMDDAVGHMPSAAFLEHIAIWSVTIFVVWFAAVLPNQISAQRGSRANA